MAIKFALLDQSVKKTGGHHLEYALRTLDCAKDAGFEPLLGAHVDFKPDSSLPYASQSVFKYTFWENIQNKSALARLREYLNERKADRLEEKRLEKLEKFHKECYSPQGLSKQRVLEISGFNDELVQIVSDDTAPIKSSVISMKLEHFKINFKRYLEQSLETSKTNFRKLPKWILGPIRNCSQICTPAYQGVLQIIQVSIPLVLQFDTLSIGRTSCSICFH